MNWFDLFPSTASQWLTTFYFFLILSSVIAVSEFLSRAFKLTSEFTRKFVHVSVGVLVFVFSFIITSPAPLVFLCFIFSIINFVIIKSDLVPALNGNRKSYGTVYYPLALLLAILILWDNHKIIFLNIVLILALADAAAAVVGQTVKKPIAYRILNDIKTVQGSVTMFLSTVLIITILYYFSDSIQNLRYSIWIVAPVIALIVTLAEAISSKGSDNLSISLISGFFLFIFFFGTQQTQAQTLYSLGFAVIFSFISIRFNFLRADGALTAGLMAIIVFGLGGWKWTLPILTFFTFSSFLSFAGKNIKSSFSLMFEKSSRRDAKQVLANGGMPVFLILVHYIYSNDLVYWLYLIALAAANADTWATELGIFNKSKPRLITTFKMAEKGQSGAVSWLGTIAALIGSALIIFSGWVFYDFQGLAIVTLLVISGFFGSLIDSLMGATIQAQYTDTFSGKVTERNKDKSGKPNKLVHGYSWINNDVVNFSSITLAVFFGFILFIIGNYF